MLKLRPFSLWLGVGCLLLGYALALSQVSADALWYDEVISYYMIGGAQFEPLLPFPQFLERILLVDRWPPLYYMSLNGWSTLVGWTTFSGRMLSILLGVLALAATFRLGQIAGGRGVGWVASALISSSAFFIYFMHETRGYTMYPLFFVLSVVFYWHMIRRETVNPLVAIAFVASILGALYTHLANYPLIFALGIYHLWIMRRSKVGVPVLFLFVIAALLTSPWLMVIYYKLDQGMSIGQTSVWFIFQEFLPTFGNGVGWLLVALIAIGLSRWQNSGFRLVVFLLSMGIAINMLINALSPFLFHMRHLIGLLPLVAVVAAAGVVQIAERSRWLAGALLSLWIAFGVWNSLDLRHSLAWAGHEPTIPTTTMNTLLTAAETCIGEEDVVILHLEQPIVRGERWEWINDVVMGYYWRDVPFRFGHISTLQPIINDSPMGYRNRVQIDGADTARYLPKARWFVGDAAYVWHLRLRRLPEIPQTAMLQSALEQSGFTYSAQPIDTPTLQGWVYSRQPALPPCEVTGADNAPLP